MRKTHIVDLHFHDLRHEAVSRFVEAGLTLPEVAQISGHRDSRSLLRYAHPSPEMIRQKFINMEGLPPVDVVKTQDQESAPLFYQLMVKNRQTPVCEGQNWGPEDFGDERSFILACTKIMRSRGLYISMPRVNQLLLLERLNGSNPDEAIEKYMETIFFQKNTPLHINTS